jgi:hypothetical protein
MTNILETIGTRRAAFCVSTFNDIFAIQLANALSDVQCLGLYLKVAPLYPHVVLADAAKRLRERGGITPPLYDAFFHELTHMSFRGAAKAPLIVACKVERRCVSLSVFIGTQLLHTEARHFSSDVTSAEHTVLPFIGQSLAEHPHASFAIEVGDMTNNHREAVTTLIRTAVRAEGIPIWDIHPDTVCSAFAIPACPTRKECRDILRTLWPDLQSKSTCEIDSVAVGVVTYCQLLLNGTSA